MARSRRGFTVVELLGVVGVIAILVAILLPALNKAREQALRVACGSQLHQFHIALVMYANDNHGWLPIVCYNPGGGTCNDVQEYPLVVGGNSYTSNLVEVFPKYLSSKRIFLCPAYDGRNEPGYHTWYSWAERGGPLDPNDYKRSNYSYLTWGTVGYYLDSFGRNSAIYGQGSIRFGQKWPSNANVAHTTNHCVWMSDVVASYQGVDGYLAGFFFASAHYSNGRNLGGNALHGEGNVEWVPISTGRWGRDIGNGYYNVSDE
jgi:type II secretory pathway pseudopilin PulG